MARSLSALVGLIALAGVSAGAHAFIITPIYITNITGTFSPQEQALVNQAAADWTSRLSLGGGNNQNISVRFQLDHGGTDPNFGAFLGQWTYLTSGGSISSPYDSNITQVITLNVDFLPQFYEGLAPPSPTDGYDVLTILRHELGHMLGFYPGLYSDANGDKWASHITGTTFDPAGLNVPMNADLAHTNVPGDLMYFSLPQGIRRDVSDTNLQMLSLAEGYSVLPVPEPAALSCLLPLAITLLRRRRR